MSLPTLKVLSIKEEGRQYRVLFRHFFRRLFQNDIVFWEDQMTEKLVATLSALAVICAFFAYSLVGRYLLQADTSSSWKEKSIYITILMIVLGFLTVLEWDILFPDTRDYSNLLTLPIRMRTLFFAKLSSLLAFAGLFALSMNLLSPGVFGFYLLKGDTGLMTGLRFLLAQLVSGLGACIFIFLSASILVGILTVLLGSRLFQRYSIYLRGLLMTAFFIQLIFFVSASSPVLRSLFTQSPETAPQGFFNKLFPPMWFTGLAEVLSGNPQPLFLSGTRFALMSLLLTPLLFLFLSALGYRKTLATLPEAAVPNPIFLRPKEILGRIFNSLVLKNPTEHAVFSFFKESLKKNSLHKMHLMTLLASSFGLVFLILAYLVSIQADLRQIHRDLLAIPLLCILILLVGIKNVINIPRALPANWIFRLTENQKTHLYISGLKKGIILLIVVPILCLCFVFFLILWGWGPALLHTLFTFGISLVLLEILLWNFRKVPFACSYLPGKAKIHMYAAVYFLGFLAYTTLLSSLAMRLLNSPIYFIAYFSLVSLALYSMRSVQNRGGHRHSSLQFEEEPETMVSLFARGE